MGCAEIDKNLFDVLYSPLVVPALQRLRGSKYAVMHDVYV